MPMRRLVAIALALLAPGAAPAQSLQGPAGTYSVALAAPGDPGLAGTFGGPAGQYTVTAPAAVTIVRTETSVTISWDVGPPPPPPPPNPPPPEPTTKAHLFAMAVFDARGDAYARLKASDAVRAALKGLDADLAVGDAATATFAPWMADLRADVPPPGLLLIEVDPATKQGRKFGRATALPADPGAVERAVIDRVKAARGAK